MTEKTPPRLLRSGLTGRIYIATGYRELKGGLIETSKKYDVTEEFHALMKQIREEEEADDI